MTAKQIDFIAKIYKDFLIKLKKKKMHKINYYIRRVNGKTCHCACIGYFTNKGIHGIHFNRTLVQYYFGERSEYSNPIGLHPGLSFKIPALFKDALLHATNNKKHVLIRDNKITEF